MVTKSCQVLRLVCRDGDQNVVIERDGFKIQLVPDVGEKKSPRFFSCVVFAAQCPDLHEHLGKMRRFRLPALEINTKGEDSWTLDLIAFDFDSGRWSRYALGDLSKDLATSALFLDALFCANQRFRTWV